MRTFKTIAVIGSLAALTVGMSAIPAQAVTTAKTVTVAGPSSPRTALLTPEICLRFLNDAGYPTTVERARGCQFGYYSFSNCLNYLVSAAGVSAGHAHMACKLAYF